MINNLTIEDLPDNLKDVACAIGIDAFRNLIKVIIHNIFLLYNLNFKQV